jgi:hypothetical protein
MGMVNRRNISRRGFLLGAVSFAALFTGTSAQAWMARREAVSPFTTNWMYVFTGYANEAAAKADLAEFVSGGNWTADVTSGIAVTGEGGYSVAVRTPLARDNLYVDKTNCRIEIHLRSKTANRTKIPYLTLIETTISGVDADEIYHSWHTNGILPSRPIGDPNSWLYQRVDGPEVFLHHNSAGIVGDIVTQSGLAAFGINGGASGGRSYSAPVYTRADDTTLYDLEPHASPFGFYPGSFGTQFEEVICAGVAVPVGATIAGGTDKEIAFIDHYVENVHFREFWNNIGTSPNYQPHRGGLMVDFTDSDLQFGRPFGAAATGNSMVHQQLTCDEFLYHGPTHALALTVITATFMWSWPAQRTDGATSPRSFPNKIMEGARFRWDPEVDIDSLGLHPLAAFYLKCWQMYGGMVNDRGGSLGTRIENEKSHILHGINERWPGIFGSSVYWEIFSAHDGYNAVDWSQMQILPAEYGHPNWRPGRLRNLMHWCDASDSNRLVTNSGISFDPSTGAWDVSGNGVELGADNEATSPDYISTGWSASIPGLAFYAAGDSRHYTQWKKLTRAVGPDLTFVAAIRGQTAVASSRLYSFRASGEANDDDNVESMWIGINAAASHYVLFRFGIGEVVLGAYDGNNHDLRVVFDGTNLTPYWDKVAGTPVPCTDDFAAETDLCVGNVIGGGHASNFRLGTHFVAASADGISEKAGLDSFMTRWVA